MARRRSSSRSARSSPWSAGRARRNPHLSHNWHDWETLERIVKTYGSAEVRRALSQIIAETGL